MNSKRFLKTVAILCALTIAICMLPTMAPAAASTRETPERNTFTSGGMRYEVIANSPARTAKLRGWAAGSQAKLSVPATASDGTDTYAVTEIADFAFMDDTALKTLDFTNASNLTAIGDSVFAGCIGLTNVSMPSGLTILNNGMFARCEKLTTVTLPNGITSIGIGAFYGCENLKSVTFPATLKAIRIEAFWACPKLTGITLPEGLETLERGAFYGCWSLKSVTLPASLKSISELGFGDCNNLTTLRFLGKTAPEIEPDAFKYIAGSGTVYYPAGGTGYTKAAFGLPGWSFKVYTASTPVSSVKLNKSTLILEKGKSFTLKHTVSPASATDKAVTWKSGNTKVATVKNGKVTAKGKGTTTITVTNKDGGKKATCKITVGIKSAAKVSLNKRSVTIKKGKTATLKATLTPKNTSPTSITWESSDPGIATVSKKGVVKGVKKGTATITALSWNGKKATCKVTVK